jgi:hypothetical protein
VAGINHIISLVDGFNFDDAKLEKLKIKKFITTIRRELGEKSKS